MGWHECEWIYCSACGLPQAHQRLRRPRFIRFLLVCHGVLDCHRLVSRPLHGHLGERTAPPLQDPRPLRPLPPELIYPVKFANQVFNRVNLILYFFENYPYFNGTLITQMVTIRYDFIISDHHLNQRPLRSIIKKLSINIKNKNI